MHNDKLHTHSSCILEEWIDCETIALDGKFILLKQYLFFMNPNYEFCMCFKKT